ncbi:uncharacterized protein L3040_005833 [Drepanopeziza brunnea f. sp. 'multigermtubi']|uniref:uncharacterized protein n=1 Tax=Drepanopeziza brunnea f. sp. 'multigermtubi' TaxID=698441 RepID=UPI0023910CC2|nr:hypothetical protein L3040_005833 [Drepanopeziza brunnea f. sp. 'multigermtubi']
MRRSPPRRSEPTVIWVANGGLVGRGVLLDYAAWAASQDLTPALVATTEIPVADLERVGLPGRRGLLPRRHLAHPPGFVAALAALSDAGASAHAADNSLAAIGVQACEKSLRWIWERRFAAVARDMPAFEALPFQSRTPWLLAGWGMPVGELFDLGRLAAECARLGKWTFFFSTVPLNSAEWSSDLVGYLNVREDMVLLSWELVSKVVYRTLAQEPTASKPLDCQKQV